MDPLWVLVILIGGASLCVAGAFILIAVEIAKVSEAVQSAEAQFNHLADKAAIASSRVAKVVNVVPRVMHVVRDADIKAEATVRAVGIVAARAIKDVRERSSSSQEVTLK